MVGTTVSGVGLHPAALYLDLLKKALTDIIHVDNPDSTMVPWRARTRFERMTSPLHLPLRALMRGIGMAPYRRQRGYERLTSEEIRQLRMIGMDWPTRAHTMVGIRRLDNLHACVETLLREAIPGDFVETGVWRGGASIFVKGALVALGDETRHVWLADSFRGLPPSDPSSYPADKGWNLDKYEELSISRQTVENNFRAYGLLDDRVHFLEGWFKDTMPTAPIERIALLRLDGDLYESTIQVLEPLYDRVSEGGFIVVDDFGLTPCRAAVEDFRSARNISDPILAIDGMAVYWRKGVATTA